MSYMQREIHEQPRVIERLVREGAAGVGKLCAAAREREIGLLLVAARGTSDHAGVFARYLFEIETGIPVSLAAPSVFTLYEADVRWERTLALGISQSGEAEDATEVLRRARAAGQLTACIVNHVESRMARAAEHVIEMRAGEERSLPATKSYTASLAAVCLLAAGLSPRPDLGRRLEDLPLLIERVLALEGEIERRAERYRYMEKCAVLARGLNQATALEVALKLAETSYVEAHPYSAADFLHGPIAIVEEGFPCFLIAPSGRGYPSMLSLAQTLHERGAETVIVSDQEEILRWAATPFHVPVTVDEALTPLLYVVIGQLFAYHLARVKGRDPDQPRGLHKVTVTR
jgi:glucosamine--fructose-6-phosphate aminotransferase (isomerizing)